MSDNNDTELPQASPPLSTIEDKLNNILEDFCSEHNDEWLNITVKQLQDFITTETTKAVYGFHEYIMGKNIIRPENDQAYNYARLHRALDDYIAALQKEQHD